MQEIDRLLLALDAMLNTGGNAKAEIRTLSDSLAHAWETHRSALTNGVPPPRGHTMNNLDRTRQAVDLAAAEYEREAARLYHPNGQPVYTDTEARKKKLLEPLRKAVEAARLTAAEHRSAAQQKRLSVYADPTAILSGADLELAFYRRAFVADDAAALPLPALAQRCKAVAIAGDRVGALLYAVYGRRRYDSELAALRKAGTMDAIPTRDMVALAGAVAPLEALTQPDKEAITQEAATMEREAGELLTHAGLKLAAVDGSNLFRVSL